MRRHQLITFSAFLFFYFNYLQPIQAQINPSSKEFKSAIDSLFADKSEINGPGASVIIVKGEKVLLTKNYGAANIPFNVPFKENTIFPLEGFTEQLVVFSILQLEKEGLLNLDDSVNKYLPELGFPNQVSLSHLINHSSGLPMMSSLRLLAGWKYYSPFTHDDFLNLTKKVTKSLKPDREFNISHGGIKLLMMIVEKVSKKNFSEYAATNIFLPLGMTHTIVKHKNYNSNKNSAIGYTKTETGYVSIVPTVFEIMCPDTYTTQSDFLKWMINIQSKKFNGEIIDKMDESLTINGKVQERTYGSNCIGQQNYRHYLGKDEFYMREIADGFSWMWLRLSQEQLSIMVVGNLDTYIGTKVNAIADLIGNYDSPISSNANETDNSTTPKLSKKEMELCTGTYWNEKLMYTTEISIKDGKLYHSDNDNGFNFFLTPVTKTLFKTPYVGGTVEFTNLEGNNKKMKNIIPNGRKFDYRQYEVPILTKKDQLKYAGIYISDELNSFYRVVLEDKKLILKRTRRTDLVLSPIGNHRFRTSDIDFRLIEFKAESKGSIYQLNFSSPVVKNVKFRKL